MGIDAACDQAEDPVMLTGTALVRMLDGVYEKSLLIHLYGWSCEAYGSGWLVLCQDLLAV